MFTLVYILLLLPGISDKTASITEASSKMSQVENSILKTNISVSGLSRIDNDNFDFNLTNLGLEKLWDYEKFTVIISYNDGSGIVTRILTYGGTCSGYPSENQWCRQSISSDNIDSGILNTNEIMSARVTVNPTSTAALATIVVSTDNGVIATQTI
ncbi:MAG: hypothetical protein HW410_1064 [Nitrosarchaeum sp.]|nr:hypothetical protein [Nitrosarchaeum sp.]